MTWFLTLGTEPIFIRICMRSSEQNRDNISSLIGGKMLNFQHGGIFYLDVSEYYNQTSDFTNKLFVTSLLWYSIAFEINLKVQVK